jgi:hypothetical protein
MKRAFSKEEVNQILKEFFPFINPIYLPILTKNINTSNKYLLDNQKENNRKNSNPNSNADRNNTLPVSNAFENKLAINSGNHSVIGKKSPSKSNEFNNDENQFININSSDGGNNENDANTFLHKKRKKFDSCT